MTSIRSHKDFIVWQKSMQIVKTAYIATKRFPKEELFGLTSQIRRASISIPSNIAEGYGRKSHKDQDQFYFIAFGSSLELETQLLLARDLGFITNEDLNPILSLLTEVIKMLHKMTHSKSTQL